MVLTKKHILERITKKELSFDPILDGFQIQPHAVDLRLGFEFNLPKTWELTKEGRKALMVDPFTNKENSRNFEKIVLKPAQYFELLPEEFVIGVTLEKISISAQDLMGVLYPRSSINRRGLAVDLSGIIDVGYSGTLMIPIINNTRDQIIRIYPGERICQVVFQTLSSTISMQEAIKHGLNTAKYHQNTKGSIGGRSDKITEIKLIQSGQLQLLKTKYGIKY